MFPLLSLLFACKGEKKEFVEKRTIEDKEYKCTCKVTKDEFFKNEDSRNIWSYDKEFKCTCTRIRASQFQVGDHSPMADKFMM